MYSILTPKLFRKRIFIFSFLCILYAGALWMYYGSNLTYNYSHYKLYYLKSYATVLEYKFTTIKSRLGALVFSGILNGDSSINKASADEVAQSVPVLLYHGILEKTDGSNVDIDTFRDQMIALKEGGYSTVSLEDFYAFLMGTKKLPAKSFVLTFDDGRKDSLYPAGPILKALGFNAVMFAIEKFSHMDSNSYYLTQNEILNMEKSGTWEIESHSRTHRNLAQIPPDELQSEINDSKAGLESLLNKQIIAFAFPFGEFGQDGSDISKKAIMELAQQTYLMSFFQFYKGKRFTQNYPHESNGHYLVKRISVLPTWSGKDLVKNIEVGTAKPLPYKATLTSTDGWINTLWGKMEMDKGTLTVKSSPDNTGSVVILDGGRLWRDYEFKTRQSWLNGSNIYLWARYQDDENYVSCNFGESGLIHIEEVVGGVLRVIKGVDIKGVNSTFPPNFDKNNFTASIRVVGRTVDCLINGVSVAKTDFLDERLLDGGVGIKTWDPILGASELKIYELSINPIPESTSVPAIGMTYHSDDAVLTVTDGISFSQARYP